MNINVNFQNLQMEIENFTTVDERKFCKFKNFKEKKYFFFLNFKKFVKIF